MKAVLEFNLDDPNEEERFHVFTKAIELYFCIYDIDARLRNETKYKDNKTAQEVRDEIYEVLNEHNLHLHMLR